MNEVWLYLMVLAGGACFGVGAAHIHIRGIQWYWVGLELLGAGWTWGLLQAIEHTRRTVVVIQVVRR